MILKKSMTGCILLRILNPINDVTRLCLQKVQKHFGLDLEFLGQEIVDYCNLVMVGRAGCP